MLAHRFLSSLNTTCSSRATFQLSRPISRANFTTSGTQLKLGTKASNAPYSRSSILTSARRFSPSEAKAGSKYGLNGLFSASVVVGAGLSLASLTARRDVVECEGKAHLFTSSVYLISHKACNSSQIFCPAAPASWRKFARRAPSTSSVLHQCV